MTLRKHKSRNNADDHTADGHSDAKESKASEAVGGSSRRAWIMRGLVTPFVGVLAVASVALGLLNATIWKPSSEITANASVRGSRYIVTDPGVLPLVDDQVKITVTTSGSEDSSGTDTAANGDGADAAGEPNSGACVAIGSGKDVNGWVAADAYTRIVGLDDWTTLGTRRQKASSQSGADSSDDAQNTGSQAGDDVAFADSDMWTKVTCGGDSVTMQVKATKNDTLALIDLGEHATAGTVALHWQRQTIPDFAMPFYFAGGLLAILAVLTASVFAMPPHKRRKRIVASAPVVEEVSVGEALAGSLAMFKPSKPRRKSSQPRRRHASRPSGSSPQPMPSEETMQAMTQIMQPVQTPPMGGTSESSGLSGSETADEPRQPIIIDPGARNLVADLADRTLQTDTGPSVSADSSDTATGTEVSGIDEAGDHEADGNAAAAGAPYAGTTESQPENAAQEESTSVITPDELQAYFARFAQEAAQSGMQTDRSDDANGEGDRQ